MDADHQTRGMVSDGAGLWVVDSEDGVPDVQLVDQNESFGEGSAPWACGSEGDLEPPSRADDDGAVDASPEARRCRDAYAALLDPLARLAASCGNLERLGAEYRRTERRARALENVLLPEIESALRRIDEHLELADQEEAIRIRWAGGLR